MKKGSARSVAGFDVYSAIKSCRDLLINFGGHTYACGLTIRWEDVPEFSKRFYKYVEEHIEPTQTEATLTVDAVIDFREVTNIGEGAFCYCRNLTSITIPNTVESIGKGAFAYCSSLVSITIPNSVTSIGISVFYDCSSLTSITIPNSVTNIGIGFLRKCPNR